MCMRQPPCPFGGETKIINSCKNLSHFCNRRASGGSKYAAGRTAKEIPSKELSRKTWTKERLSTEKGKESKELEAELRRQGRHGLLGPQAAGEEIVHQAGMEILPYDPESHRFSH